MAALAFYTNFSSFLFYFVTSTKFILIHSTFLNSYVFLSSVNVLSGSTRDSPPYTNVYIVYEHFMCSNVDGERTPTVSVIVQVFACGILQYRHHIWDTYTYNTRWLRRRERMSSSRREVFNFYTLRYISQLLILSPKRPVNSTIYSNRFPCMKWLTAKKKKVCKFSISFPSLTLFVCCLFSFQHERPTITVATAAATMGLKTMISFDFIARSEWTLFPF